MSDDRLRLLVERIERISAEIADLQHDRKDVYAEAKAVGYCAATLRKVVARRAMAPCDRAEADALLESYENALGGLAEPVRAIEPSVAARELALAILAEQVEGIGDPAQAAALAEHVAIILDIRAEKALLSAQEKARKALAATEGFDAPAITRVVRWIEKCAKHGVDAMRAGEALFQLYRGSLDARGGPVVRPEVGPVTGDPKLQKILGGQRSLVSKLAWHDAGDL